MNRQTTLAKNETHVAEWLEVDASGQVLGRLATRIATVLMGKHKPGYTAHVDTGDFVIVTNATNIVLTGNKATQKFYQTFSGHPSGQRYQRYDKLMAEKPELLVELAVKRMLPKSRLGRQMLSKMKVYAGTEHQHSAQKPQQVDPNTMQIIPEA